MPVLYETSDIIYSSRSYNLFLVYHSSVVSFVNFLKLIVIVIRIAVTLGRHCDSL